MNNYFKLRLATLDDVELLTDLRLQMRRERETAELSVSEETFRRNNLDYFSKFIADGSYVGVIAEIEGKVAATGGICFHNHPPSYSVPNGKSACLLNMFTLPDFRGRGLAGKIVAFLVEEARKADCCQVFLNASVMGKGVYEKFGFVDVANEMVYKL